ncbi:intradiol ring-cleavage dioxygenase [Pararhodobacter zhoushanensis]|uniref:Intradiol ring-cleavage dioxygenase n=1 Tax=Pararhodobacter zhoushanensis TaxID=2479545 RepID=A0ABT3H4Q3_9RHOB|nr:intradiol ring-cleavage dioxygenase [Pararhodobacter zhoushanensis]MCW1934777.1 intradiol ring-cleavage dioxygenase [Pararhodobacter zhoushanensis]
MTDFPLNRRQVLTTLAVGASGLMLPRLVYADTSALIPGSDVCALTPGVTEGPYYLDTGLIRRDITEGRPGVPVHLRLQVVDAACAPIEGARVDLWHCDAQGVYSSFGGDSGQSSARGETFLRGTQIADAQGIVTFDTIYPGWYRGRTTHMHFKVWLDEHTVLTGQIFVPDALSEYLYLNVPAYQREGARDTVNRTDRIAQQATQASFAAVTEEDSAYLVQMIIGVDPMANADTDNDRPPLPPGSRPPADSPMDGGRGASAPLVPGSG